MQPAIGKYATIGLALSLCLIEISLAGPSQRTRHSQRVRLEEVYIASLDGNIKLTVLPNAERLSFTMTLGNTVVMDPSTIVMNLDGYDLSSGVVFGKVERYEIDETYPWHGAHNTAVNKCNGAKISLQHDLSFTDYVLEVRVYNDGAAFRHIIVGDEGISRVPDEYTTFVIPAGSMVWYHDLGGHYEALLKKAAENQMVVNFHVANKPTGRACTWPNEVVREAVRGMESSSLRERARHETILPFARYLAGHADYTTMHFSDRRQDTTRTHQIASLAIFASPLLTVAVHPKSVLDNPAVDVIKSIPAVWNQTIVLPESTIGELAIFARRTGQTWFLAVMCGPQAKTIHVPLSFLGDGPYNASLVSDDKENDAAVILAERTVRQGDTLEIEMVDGGGFVGRFSEQ